MNQADRLEQWNRWYDGLPDEWRFQFVLWPVLIVGAINMVLTIGFGFPFGLLVVLAIAALACCRVPYAFGWVQGTDPNAPHGQAGGAKPMFQLGRIDWVWNVNTWYEAQPELVRFWVVPAVLILVGTINMILTISARFPFGLLFLIALVGVAFIRGSYTSGWLTEPPDVHAPAQPVAPVPLLTHEDTKPAVHEPVVAAPTPSLTPPPPAAEASQPTPEHPTPEGPTDI